PGRRARRRLGVTQQCVQAALAAEPASLAVACRGCEAVIQARSLSKRRPSPALCLACLERHPEAPFAHPLSAFRLAAGLTQGELGGRAGLPKGTVNSYERGEGQPTWPAVVALARVLRAGLLTLGLGLPEGPGHEPAGG